MKQENLRAVDKELMAESHYANSSKLQIRKDYGRLSVPRTSLEKELIDFALEKKPERILDVGCGNGDFLLNLRKAGFSGKLYGIDISPGMINEANEKNNKENAGINFSIGDVMDLKFRDEYFEMIVAKHMLYHLPLPQKGIDEMHRCLKKGRALLITLNSKRNKPHFFKCERMICKKYNLKSVHGQLLVSVESAASLLGAFSKIETIYKEGKINAPHLFSKYFESVMGNLDPQPGEELREKILKDVENYVLKESKKGEFFETNVTGLIIAVK